MATSSPGAQTPKTPPASWGPFSPGRRSCERSPSPRATKPAYAIFMPPPTVGAQLFEGQNYLSNRGSHGDKSDRSPLARTKLVASAQLVLPTHNSSQVRASVSTTAEGVPRRCVRPGIACTAAYGGIRTSTLRPGATWIKAASASLTASFTAAAAGSSPRANSSSTSASE